MSMYLRTLGGLWLEGSEFRRPKPLLLLAYLALEGAKPRRYLAELFFMEASDRMNSLSRALSYLRQEVPGVVEADNKKVWATISCDAAELLNLTDSKQFEKCLELYGGTFAVDYDLELSGELEEWLYGAREYLAGRFRNVLLQLAEQEASKSNFSQATKHAERAYTLISGPELEPEHLSRFYALFVAGNSSYATQVRAAAKEFDIDLSQTTLQSQHRLHKPFLGRKRELERLGQLETGQWAWVRGGAGIGKTSLLQQLHEQYVPGRMGLPYATLEPLVSDLLNDGAEAILRRLSKGEKTLCIDDWENIDPESQDILKRLRTLKPNLKVIVSGVSVPPFAVDVLLELNPLPRETLEATKDLWEKTGGVPKLVGAHLRGESLAEALEATLSALSEYSRNVYLALALLEEPDLSLVRRALALAPDFMFTALEELSSAGLVTTSGRGQLEQLAKDYLATKPHLLALLALQLARQLEATRAFPLFQAAKTLWSNDDVPKVQKAYLAWAKEILERGFPQRAADVLAEIEANDDITLLKAQALERAGQYRLAFDTLVTVPETTEVLALQATLYWRLGYPDLAKQKAEEALDGNLATRASALTTLGELARSSGQFEKAISYYRRAGTLWKAENNQTAWIKSLNSMAAVYLEDGKDLVAAQKAYEEALKLAKDNPTLTAMIMGNLAVVFDKRQQSEKALTVYKEVIALAREVQALITECRAWNNLAIFHEAHNDYSAAREAYHYALKLAKASGETYMIGLITANLAELDQDAEAFEEALVMLSQGGYDNAVQDFRSQNLILERKSDEPSAKA